MEPLLDATATYEPGISTGVFSYATHGAVVAVDPETGAVELLDFAVAEDCGTMVNPMLVEGQIRGGVAQGIGTALCEEIPYDEPGQPLAATFLDYHLPAAFELPPIRIGHLHTPGDRDRIRHEGHGRRRRRRPARGDRQRRARRARAIGAEVNETPITAAPRARGDPPGATSVGWVSAARALAWIRIIGPRVPQHPRRRGVTRGMRTQQESLGCGPR